MAPLQVGSAGSQLLPRVRRGRILCAKDVEKPCHRTPGLPLKAGSACTSGNDRDK